jgi:hypothetical protein
MINKVLKEIFRLKRQAVIEEFREMHNAVFRDT